MKPTKEQLRYIVDAVYDKFKFVADQTGKKEFIKDRVRMALEVGAKTYHEILFIALNAPLLRPDKYAIQAVKTNAADYLNLVGCEDLIPYHDDIIELAIEYHEHILYPSICISRETTAVSHDSRYQAINTWQGFSSELCHRIPLGYDWDAIAYFIVTDSKEHGKALQIRDEHGDDALVYKGVIPDGCEVCKAIYLTHKWTPEIFKVKDLIQSNTNRIDQRINSDSACTIPTSGPNHLYCSCMLHRYTGYEAWAHKI